MRNTFSFKTLAYCYVFLRMLVHGKNKETLNCFHVMIFWYLILILSKEWHIVNENDKVLLSGVFVNVCNSILGNTYLYICHFMNCKSNTIGMLHITWLEEIHYLLLLWQKSPVRFRNFVKFWVNYNLIMTVPSIMNNVLYLFWAFL